ncbi:MAG: hypothetical protein PVG20_04265 [Thioalkalispiraceae bacterium]|jgi:hypothetical protein
MYSKRLLQPFVGVIQIADFGWARALSLDGKNWAIRYAHDETPETLFGSLRHDPRVNLSLLVSIEGNQFNTRVIRKGIKSVRVKLDTDRIFDVLSAVRLPFEPGDRYEYWLLDENDEKPLALLHSCIDEEEMQWPLLPTAWVSIPSAELDVADPIADNKPEYVTPVNYRLQKSIEERAGKKPKTVWFERPAPVTDDFPSCLISEEWDDPESQRCCELYLQRLAPRLLMLDGLPRSVRQRLEPAACEHVFDVHNFYPLYPEVIDDSRLKAARVEARVRKANDA